jgi:16S rRNA (cytosine967-C5)-methyltransferase
MDEPPLVHHRADGYVQDLASQWVVREVGARPGELVVDLCAAPGGKATGMAGDGATVVAADLQPHRVGLVVDNARRLGCSAVLPLVADATAPPFRPGTADRVLVDAPCSGLGVLRRRPDARWRLDAAAPDRLADLAARIVDAAVALVRPGGVLVLSVCTLTAAETIGLDRRLEAAHPELEPLPPPSAPWRPWGRGALLLPQDAGTDGMSLFRYRTPAGTIQPGSAAAVPRPNDSRPNDSRPNDSRPNDEE